jgi:hypothetical protein
MDERQRALVEFLLSADFPGAAALRSQLPYAVVESEDGFGGFMLAVPPGVERADVVDIVPVEATWIAPTAELTLMLVTPDGVLGEVQVLRANYDLEILPDLEKFTLYVRRFKGEKFHRRSPWISTN